MFPVKLLLVSGTVQSHVFKAREAGQHGTVKECDHLIFSVKEHMVNK